MRSRSLNGGLITFVLGSTVNKSALAPNTFLSPGAGVTLMRGGSVKGFLSVLLKVGVARVVMMLLWY